MIGIDLGTTNSLIAYWQEASGEDAPRARLIPNSEGSVLTPSAVSVSDTGTLLIGNAALQRRLTHPTLTATEFKRDMGSERQYQLGKTSFSPEQLSAFVLSSLKADAEAALKRPVCDVVISVPAYFNDTQRKATMVAAQLADLSVSRLINEPTAAALAYGLGDMLVAADAEDDGLAQSTLVFDLGGGTFDVSIVDLFEGIIEIKASTGDNYLGGEDFTQAIARCITVHCELDENLVANGTPEQRARLRSVAERLKCELSNAPSVTGRLKLDGKQFEVTLTEADLESACAPLLERIRQPVARAMRDARLHPETLDSIVLVGGTTRMPIVRKLVARLFGRFPETAVHPDHAIALGAATQAALIARDLSLDEVLLTDVSPFSLGIEHSSEASGRARVDGLFSPIIERNVMIPASRVESYVTLQDNQAQLLIEIYQGEHRFVKDNVKLGSLQIDIPKRKAGEVQMNVRFTYDASGLLEVDVDVPGTDIQKSLSLLGNAARLNEKDIEQKRQELQLLKIHPRDDLPNRALLERADRLYSELSGQEREQVGESLNEFVAILETQDPHLIRTKRQAFAEWLSEVERLL